MSATITGLEQAHNIFYNLRRNALVAVLLGMLDGAHDVVVTAKDLAPSKTGRLKNSLRVLDWGARGNTVFVVVGSDILGYPFYQEYGWTTSRGNYIPGKFFLTAAVIVNASKFPEYIKLHMQTLSAGRT